MQIKKAPARTPCHLFSASNQGRGFLWGSLWGPAEMGKEKLSLEGDGRGRGYLKSMPRLWQSQLPEQRWQKARAQVLPMYRWSSLGSSRTCWHSHVEQAETGAGRGREKKDMNGEEAASNTTTRVQTTQKGFKREGANSSLRNVSG